MQSYFNILSLSLAAIILSFGSSAVYAKKLYRWLDDNGNTYFSDQVPPEYIKHRHETLSKKGRVIGVTEKAKSKEEIELDKRLAALRKAQEKIIDKQISYDKVLLSTYRSLDDLLYAVKNKTQTMDNQLKASEGTLYRLKIQLESQQKKAAAFERNAQKAPESLLGDITSTFQQIQDTQISISKMIEKRNSMKREDDADIERYLFLTQLRNEITPRTQKIPSIKEANELGLFYCENDHQCNKAWEIARTFVNFHSTTGPDIDNNKLIMSRSPSKDSDLSLSLSKIGINEIEYQLFLDIRCRESSLGRELCNSQKASDIRTAFRPYINSALSRTTHQ